MADIELVIKIPEELYYLVQNKLDFNGDLDNQKIKTIMLAIDNGIPLPKGHGRLIDVDTLEFRNVTVSYGYDWECGESTYAEEEVIIEADKTESEDRDLGL